MKRYFIELYGRLSGAIGMPCRYVDYTTATTWHEAFENLYFGRTESGQSYDSVMAFRVGVVDEKDAAGSLPADLGEAC